MRRVGVTMRVVLSNKHLRAARIGGIELKNHLAKALVPIAAPPIGSDAATYRLYSTGPADILWSGGESENEEGVWVRAFVCLCACVWEWRKKCEEKENRSRMSSLSSQGLKTLGCLPAIVPCMSNSNVLNIHAENTTSGMSDPLVLLYKDIH